MCRLIIDREYFNLFESLLELISNGQSFTTNEIIQKLLRKGYEKEPVQESIFYLIAQNFLEIVDTSKRFENIKLKLHKKPELSLAKEKEIEDYPKLVMNLPPYNIFGLKTKLQTFEIPYYDLKQELKHLFKNASENIYICSPFLQLNGFQFFIPILIDKAKRGVDIKIISRQIAKKDKQNRYEETKKIYKKFRKENADISIRNYHYQTSELKSSTHAKFIICDNEYAYIGSGELRKPSFEKNFEVGVILVGEKALHLSYMFESLFSVSTKVEFDEGDQNEKMG